MFDFGNNYIKFPNGLIIQWGTEYLSTGAGTTINLKVAFKTVNYSVSAIDGGAGTYILGIDNHQINSFRVFNRIPGTNLYATGNYFRWIAVGY